MQLAKIEREGVPFKIDFNMVGYALYDHIAQRLDGLMCPNQGLDEIMRDTNGYADTLVAKVYYSDQEFMDSLR